MWRWSHKPRPCCLLSVLAALAFAADPPKPTGFVTDLDDRIPAAERLALDYKFRRYEQDTSTEIVVVIVNSLNGQSVELYANGLLKPGASERKSATTEYCCYGPPPEGKVRIEVGLG